MLMVLPIGFSLKKYFFAIRSVITIVAGFSKAKSEFPAIKGKVNTLKKSFWQNH